MTVDLSGWYNYECLAQSFFLHSIKHSVYPKYTFLHSYGVLWTTHTYSATLSSSDLNVYQFFTAWMYAAFLSSLSRSLIILETVTLLQLLVSPSAQSFSSLCMALFKSSRISSFLGKFKTETASTPPKMFKSFKTTKTDLEKRFQASRTHHVDVRRCLYDKQHSCHRQERK